MSKGRSATHYVIQRIFLDPKRWGRADLQDRFFAGLFDGVAQWGPLYEAKLYTFEGLNDAPLLVEEHCDIVIQAVRLVLPKHATTLLT